LQKASNRLRQHGVWAQPKLLCASRSAQSKAQACGSMAFLLLIEFGILSLGSLQSQIQTIAAFFSKALIFCGLQLFVFGQCL
jgi:hypothetical protein